MIDHLQQRFASQEDTTILYVYNNYRERELQLTTNLIGALLQQIVLKRRRVFPEIIELYQRHQTSRTRATTDDLCEVLCGEIQKFNAVFVLIDALDEFNGATGDREPLIIQLRRILEMHSARLMITSRDNVKIESSIPDALHLQIRASDEDIRNYLVAQISENLIKFRVKPDTTLQLSIIDILAWNAKDM